MKRNDLLTNEQFFAGRITQKFARPANRIKWHNRKATKLRQSIAYIQKPLQQNLKILLRLMQDEEEKKLHKQFLLGCGFDFSKLTNFVSIKGIDFPCIFNYYIQPIEGNMILIKKLKSEK